MRHKLLPVFLSFLLVSCSTTDLGVDDDKAVQNVPEPSSWSFPGVIESARLLAPVNVEGKTFNRFGLVYSMEAYSSLDLASMPASDLQKYADIVTHAYPDAVSRKLPSDCSSIPLYKLNGASVAGLAYVSIHALQQATRQKAASCFDVIQKDLKRQVPNKSFKPTALRAAA